MADPKRTFSITICMGSSCFCRGNNRNIEVIQNVIAEAKPRVDVTLKGQLCQNQCKKGPNVIIDGKAYNDVDPIALVSLLNYRLLHGEPRAP